MPGFLTAKSYMPADWCMVLWVPDLSKQVAFIWWLKDLLLASLYPGAPFQRKYMALSVLNLLLKTESDSPAAAAYWRSAHEDQGRDAGAGRCARALLFSTQLASVLLGEDTACVVHAEAAADTRTPLPCYCVRCIPSLARQLILLELHLLCCQCMNACMQTNEHGSKQIALHVLATIWLLPFYCRGNGGQLGQGQGAGSCSAAASTYTPAGTGDMQ